MVDPASTPLFLSDGGEMGERLRTHPWEGTSLGPPQGWPPALATLVGVMLGSNQAMFIAWGPDRVLLYNEAYAEVLADKHPAALGRDFLDVWDEIRADIIPIVGQAYAGVPVHMDDITLILNRRGYQEETHFAFSYTPVRDEGGEVAGFFCPCNDITGQIMAERRLRESEARARGVLDGMGEGFVLFAQDFTILDVNAETLRLEQRPRDELIGRSYWEVYPGTQESELGRTYQRAMADRVPVALDHRYTWPDGRDTWLEMRAYPVGEGLAIFFGDVTDRKRAEALEQETAERYRLAARATNDAIWDWHFETNHVLWNEALETGHGHRLADVPPTGEWWLDHIHPEDRDRVHHGIDAAIEGAAHSWNEEYRFRRADGSYAEVLDRGHLIRDASGRATRMIGAMLDVTEQRRSEAALADNEERLRLAIEAAEVGFWDVVVVTDVLIWSPRVKAMFGISADVPTTMQDFYDGVHPEDREATLDAFAAASDPERRALYDVDYRTVGKEDGIVRWVAAKGRGVFEGDRCVRIVGTAIDVTARKQLDQALRDLNATLEERVAERTAERDRMWDTSPDLMVVLDFDGVFRRVNPAWTTVLGYAPDELVGRHVNEFVISEDHQPTTGAYETAAQGVSLAIENRYLHKDGSIRWIAWTAAPTSEMTYAVGRDVTAAREAQAQLEQAQEALRQSQKMEAVGQLTGGIAHDFNNMLAVVIGSLDLLHRRIGAGDARATRYLDAAADGARRAANLTQRLLAFSRQQPLQPESIETNKLVAGMSELIRGSLGSDVRLETVLASGLWRTHADPNQLENVLLNLAVNARDAMPDGGRLTIETGNCHLDGRYAAAHPGLNPGQYVMIAVTDTGEGMSPEVIAKAFDPFFTTKSVGKGTGLGLSQVYGFVKQSGGHVKIYSEPGQGTTLKVYLPRLVADADGAAEEESTRDVPLGEQDEVILVVEDEPSVRQFSTDALTELGYRVLEADGAAAALRLLDTHPEIALMFTDVVMPDVNGARLAEEARRRRPDLRVLFTTGYTRNAVVHNGVLDPGVELIGKPFTIEELAARVREVLDAPSPP